MKIFFLAVMGFGFYAWASSGAARPTDVRTDASLIDGLRCFDPLPIDELFRTMLGRNTRPEEAAHFAKLIVEGEQVAYFEPYLASDCTKNPKAMDCQQRATCFSWVDYVTDSNRVGPAFYVGAEFLGYPDYAISTLYRTLFGNLPDPLVKKVWIEKLKGGTLLQRIAQEMQAQLPSDSEGSWDAIDDVFLRVLGRRADHKKCSFRNPNRPDRNTDCSWFWAIANGSSVLDLVHGVRSMPEAIVANESQECVQANPNQNDPHALGEYVRQMFRLLLRRNPKPSEMSQALSDYSGGSTRPRLNALAIKILKSREYRKICSE